MVSHVQGIGSVGTPPPSINEPEEYPVMNAPHPKYLLARALPKRLLTQVAGAASGLPLPKLAREPVYRAYAAAVGANLEECGAPIASFPTFNDFFARPLVDGLRPWSDAPFSSPSDGRLAACGTVKDGRLIQAKGIDYAVDELLVQSGASERYEGGVFATVYLSPADYHRVHAPCDFALERIQHVAGELWPVNGLSVPFVDGLFRRNERVIFEGRTPTGQFVAVVMVGATVVGKVRACVGPDGATAEGAASSTTFDTPWSRSAGDELGAFLLGSTAVVLVSPGEQPLELCDSPGQPVRLGAALWR